MPALRIRNIPAGDYRALKQRAGAHGHSIEAEALAMLANALHEDEQGFGSALRAIGRHFEVTTEFDNLRDTAPARVISFQD